MDSRRRIDLGRENDMWIGALTVRPSTREIVRGDRVEVLEPRVMQVLVALGETPGSVVSRDELIERCWQGRVVGEDALHRCIGKLRRLPDAVRPFEIDTIARVGFRLRITDPGSARPDLIPSDHPSRGPMSRPRRLAVIVGMVLLIAACAGVVGIKFAPALLAWRQPEPTEVYRGLRRFSDCAQACPEMVALPAGKLKLAPTARDPWGPPRTITFPRGFAISRYDITRGEYAAFVKDTGYAVSNTCFTVTKAGDMAEGHGSWSDPGFPQTDRDPAVCISWDDANAYATWLSQRTGASYRLPSETEWTYAAGPEATLMGPPGSLPCKRLNGADRAYHAKFPGDPAVDLRCGDGFAFTSPVGRFPANIYGLYDMLGNVWQWVQDCYAEQPLTLPLNGEASSMTPCSARVVRGGSWSDDLKKIRLMRRGQGSPGDRYPQNGFRVARDL